jgi:hypothetical protein
MMLERFISTACNPRLSFYNHRVSQFSIFSL